MTDQNDKPEAPTTRSPSIPKWITPSAYLVPEGETRKLATIHHLYELRQIEGSVDAQGEPVLEFEILYRCFRTGAIRRWGTYCPDIDLPEAN